MTDNLKVVVTHDAPADIDNPELYWRADLVVCGVFGADKTVIATGFGREDKRNGQGPVQAQGQAITAAWHQVHQSTPIERP